MITKTDFYTKLIRFNKNQIKQIIYWLKRNKKKQQKFD